MNEKKNLIKLMGFMIIFLAIFAGFVWFADPFFQYHAPMGEIPIVLEKAVYQTAGAARNLEYDSAIVGTSMTENIHTAWLNEGLGWNTMKLCYAGARSDDLKAVLSQVEQKEGALKNILIDINDYQLTSPAWTAYTKRPEYLYDTYLLNDYEYLFNYDAFLMSMKRCMDGLGGVEDNVDYAYTWEEASLFGSEIAKNTCKDVRENYIRERLEEMSPESIYEVSGSTTEQLEEKLKVCEENLANILPFIERNPHTQVYIIVPPYSMLYWERNVLAGELEDKLSIYAHAIEKFLQYDNVRVFYFQYEPEIISNLEIYRDEAHHNPEINRYIVDCIISGKQEVTLDNYGQRIREMYDYAKDYPYETMWE